MDFDDMPTILGYLAGLVLGGIGIGLIFNALAKTGPNATQVLFGLFFCLVAVGWWIAWTWYRSR